MSSPPSDNRGPAGFGLLLSALLGLGGAGCGERTLADCADADCRGALILTTYATDRAAALAELAQVQDPGEHDATLLRLVEAHPGDTRGLCETLRHGPSRDRCARIQARPHLWRDPAPAPIAKPRAAPGPADMALAIPSAPAGPMAELPPVPGACAEDPDRASCATAEAVREARKGSARRAAGSCQAIEAPRWRDECLFSASETLILARGARGVVDGSALCLAAGEFASNCMRHLLERLAQGAPDATELDPEAWAPLIASGESLSEFWSEADPARAPLVVDRFWSEVARNAYAATPAVSGGLLALLPAEAAPHLRAAAAARLVELEGVGAHASLEDWVAALNRALARAPGPASTRDGGPLRHDREVFWPEDLGAEDGSIPAIFYMGTARRAVSADPAADLRLCLLEALARVGLVRGASPAARAATRQILDGAVADPDPIVRWTATRLRDRPPVTAETQGAG